MKKIVLIEDNLSNAKLIMKVLRREDYQITHAIDATTGLQLAQDIRPNLILLDFGLPDLDGTTVAKMLKHLAYTRHIPILAVTGNTSSDVQRTAILNGCEEVILKPYDTRMLRTKVAEYLGVPVKV